MDIEEYNKKVEEEWDKKTGDEDISITDFDDMYDEEDKRFEDALNKAKNNGLCNKININRHEYDLLEKCDKMDIKKFIKDEFEKKPINYDSNGNLILT